MRERSHSVQTVAVLQALALDPPRWRYGYDLCSQLGLKSGSLYPILIRLAERDLLESSWEQSEPGKPPRHVYRLTGAGMVEAAAADPPARPAATRRRQLGPA
jgi:PadR family transcriptional regulator, regulatory protein PadR